MAKVRKGADSTRKVWSQNLVIQPDLWVDPGMSMCYVGAMFNKKLSQFFQFNRQERWGLLILLGSLGSIYGISAIFPKNHVDLPRALNPVKENTKDIENQQETKIIQRSDPVRIGKFDPNTTTKEDWISMGIPARTARTIRRYLAKGGRFRRPEDLSRIWGMREEDLQRLLPNVRIPERERITKREESYAVTKKYDSDKKTDGVRTQLDINRSDSIAWESLPGIGPGYARRILRYRERLGGFIRVDQIAETYQLPDSVFQRIRPLLAPTPSSIRTIDINQVSIDTLGRHPYCGYPMARLIVRYREQHGPYEKLDDLLQIQRVDSVWWTRIRPYLRVQ